MSDYTTTMGNTVKLTPLIWRGIKRVARSRFDGSLGLFEACWRQYLTYVNGGTDNPTRIDDVTGWLDAIASEKVNNPESKFYIHG